MSSFIDKINWVFCYHFHWVLLGGGITTLIRYSRRLKLWATFPGNIGVHTNETWLYILLVVFYTCKQGVHKLVKILTSSNYVRQAKKRAVSNFVNLSSCRRRSPGNGTAQKITVFSGQAWLNFKSAAEEHDVKKGEPGERLSLARFLWNGL